MLRLRKPHWGWLLVFVLAETLFVWAARWQWRRGEEKDARLRAFDVAMADASPRDVTRMADLATASGEFEAVRLRGSLLMAQAVLHDNRMVEGEYGVEVYAPLALEDGYILVNLGWLPADRARRTAPVLPPVPAAFAQTGLLAASPPMGFQLLRGSAPPLAQRDRLRIDIDPDEIAHESPVLLPMASRVFWPAPESGSSYRRHWKPGGMPADRHRGYAMQWASFAVASLVLLLMFSFRRKESSDD